jgi:hypothetical protein
MNSTFGQNTFGSFIYGVLPVRDTVSETNTSSLSMPRIRLINSNTRVTLSNTHKMRVKTVMNDIKLKNSGNNIKVSKDPLRLKIT